MTEEYRNLCQRTRDNLKQAQLSLQRVQFYIDAAKSFHALSPSERKMLDKVKINLVEPIEEIDCVINSLNIQLKYDNGNT